MTANGRVPHEVYPMTTGDCVTAIIFTIVAFAVGKFWGRIALAWCLLSYWLRNIYGASEALFEMIMVAVAVVLGAWQVLHKSLV